MNDFINRSAIERMNLQKSCSSQFIWQLIDGSETQTVEFKRQLPKLKSMAKTIGALANTNGNTRTATASIPTTNPFMPAEWKQL